MPSLMGRVFQGFRAFFQGLAFVHKQSLYRYVLLPSLCSLAIGIVIIWLSYVVLAGTLTSGAAIAIGNVAGWLGHEDPGLPLWGLWVLRAISIFLSLMVQLIAYRAVAGILVIPFMGPLLAQVELKLTGKVMELSLAADIRNSVRGIWVGIKFALLALLALILGLFLGPFQIITNALVQGYALGRGAFDYIFEKEAEQLASRAPLIKKFRAEIMGLGLAFWVVLFVPVVGVLIGPVAATVGAALLYHSEESQAKS